MSCASSGHRARPHTADVRIEAWGTSREACLAEAVRGLVECFADVTGVHPTRTVRVPVGQATDEDLLLSVLDEVIYLLDVSGEVVVDVQVDAADGGLDLRLAMAATDAVEITGAAPKAVALHGLRLAEGAAGWTALATVDV